MPIMELSQDEVDTIERIRAEREYAAKKRAETLYILRTAYEYEKWLQENEAGSSYSTFCDDFGYSGEHREWMYSVISSLRDRAREESG